MRWLARRPSANAGSPQADPPDAGARDADDVLPGPAELLAAAERFIGLFHDENPTTGAFADRMRQVRGEVQAHGTTGILPRNSPSPPASRGGTVRAASAACTGVRCGSGTGGR